jgi:hypothetical protein
MNMSKSFLYITTSRATPGTARDKTDLVEHIRTDPRVPFHAWVAYDGSYVEEVRDDSEDVMPDPGIWPVIVPHLWVVCLSGWYQSSRARTEGEPGPMRQALDALQVYLRGALSKRGLSAQSLTGPWDFGHHAWAGDMLEWTVRKMRGEMEPYRAPNQWECVPIELLSVKQRRDALAELGFEPFAGADPNGIWTIADQLALGKMQTALCVESTGYWDPATILACREVLSGSRQRSVASLGSRLAAPVLLPDEHPSELPAGWDVQSQGPSMVDLPSGLDLSESAE